jgi:outer membrane lipoprotein-sorting protein
MKHLLLIGALLISFVYAQQTIHKCYTDEYVQLLDQQNPGFKNQVNTCFHYANEWAQLSHKSEKSLEDSIFRIPVVFHVVYKGTAQNVSESLLLSQIAVLNEDFRRLNADSNNTRALFKDRAADVGFEFFLATIDPEGNPTTGITRTSTTTTFNFFDLDAMKSSATGGKDAWNTAEYLNIWVCDLGGAILGFAYPPSAAPNWPGGQTPSDPAFDGVVLHYQVVGYDNPGATGQLSIADKGRTAVHEVGHYFGLRHIWGDSGNPFTGAPDCDITQDDGFSDTPHMGNNSQQTGCSFSKNTCTNGESPDEPDMVENYMDYSTETCQNMFTQQQANLMRSMAVIGRPDLAKLILDDVFEITNGEWIVINNTDTVQLGNAGTFVIQSGDQVMFLNENNGYNYTAEGTYTIDGNAFEANVTEEGTFTVEALSISATNLSTFIELYPNPSANIVNIKSSEANLFNGILVYDVKGSLVASKEMSSSTFNTLNIESLENGIYFMHFLKNNEKIGASKFSILK